MNGLLGMIELSYRNYMWFINNKNKNFIKKNVDDTCCVLVFVDATAEIIKVYKTVKIDNIVLKSYRWWQYILC